MKIALISPPFLRTPPGVGGQVHYGGLEVVVADLAEVLAKKGHEVTVFAADGSKVKGCKIIEFGPPPLRVDVIWVEKEMGAYQVYKDKLKGFDIIHGHNWYGFEYAAKAENRKLHVCHTHHGGRGRSLLHWKTHTPRFRLNLIAISKWMQKIYKATGLKAKRVYNGINLSRYPFEPDKGERLIFVGRFDSFKGPHVAIHVARKLGLGLDLVGGTWVRDVDYLERIKKSCDGKQIKIYPNAPHKTKLRLLQKALALLFPSKMGEPFGLVPVEAMSCGTPVIALRDGAVPEVVKEGGVVCNDVNEMTTAVKKIRLILSKDCRRNAERFSREIMTKNYLRLYREILGRKEW